MKKIIVVLSVLSVFLLGCVVFLLNNTINLHTYRLSGSSVVNDKKMLTGLSYSDLEITQELTGTVVSSGDMYFKEYTCNYKVDVTMYYDKGEVVSKNDPIACIDGKDFTMDSSIRIVNYTIKNGEFYLKYIDNSALYIETYFPAEDIDKIDYNTTVYYELNNTKMLLTVSDITYEVVGGLVYVSLQPEITLKYLPGTELDVSFVLEYYETSLIVPEMFLSEDNNGIYIYIVTEDELGNQNWEQRYVTVLKESEGNVAIDFDLTDYEKGLIDDGLMMVGKYYED